MRNERLTTLAMELLVLGVSRAGVEKLLSHHDLDEVERQLAYLPYRHAKRPEAFIVEAVRNKYSPPKEFFYAANESAATNDALDQDPEPVAGQPDAFIEGHRTQSSARSPQTNRRLAESGSASDDSLPDIEGSNR